jgi:hypothetical protein
MKAVVCHSYGSRDVLKLEGIDKPVVPDDGVLLRVHASSVHPADFYSLTRVLAVCWPLQLAIGRCRTGTIGPRYVLLLPVRHSNRQGGWPIV